MRVLLVGGLGFIGKRFIEKFSDCYELIIYAKDESLLKAQKTISLKDIIVETGLIENKKIIHVIEKHKPDIVIHLAAITGLTKCDDAPEEAFKVNVYGTFNLIQGCLKTKSKIIFFSSREVYGDTLKESSEDDSLSPNNTYGITKMIGETLVQFTSQKYDLDYTILRLTNVYGPGSYHGINAIIKSAIKENKIQIFGENRFINLIYIDDVVDSINFIINDNRSSKQVFNVGSNDTLTTKEFALQVSDLIKTNVKVDVLPEKKIESNFKPNLKKIQTLGYLPKTPLKTGIEKTIKWCLNEKSHL